MALNKLEIDEMELHFENYAEHLSDFFPSRYEIEEIIKYCETDNYFQILYVYGENLLLVLLNYFEYIEEYSTAQEILHQIEQHNKLTGERIKTHL